MKRAASRATLPQPPPNAPAPPPNEVVLRSRRWWRGIWIVGAASMVLVGIAPLFLRSRKSADLTQAVSNARQIGFALGEYQEESGRFPSPFTLSPTSNEIFRELLTANVALTEGIFYARIPGARRPDEMMTKGETLKKGEVGFTYLLGTEPTDRPDRPLVVTPMIVGTKRFSPKGVQGRAVILTKDNSVRSLPIDRRGRVLLYGMDLMDPHHPVWEGRPPTIAWPEF